MFCLLDHDWHTQSLVSTPVLLLTLLATIGHRVARSALFVSRTGTRDTGHALPCHLRHLLKISLKVFVERQSPELVTIFTLPNFLLHSAVQCKPLKIPMTADNDVTKVEIKYLNLCISFPSYWELFSFFPLLCTNI